MLAPVCLTGIFWITPSLPTSFALPNSTSRAYCSPLQRRSPFGGLQPAAAHNSVCRQQATVTATRLRTAVGSTVGREEGARRDYTGLTLNGNNDTLLSCQPQPRPLVSRVGEVGETINYLESDSQAKNREQSFSVLRVNESRNTNA
jgi:hypothetical protein